MPAPFGKPHENQGLAHSATSGIDPKASRALAEHAYAVVDLGTNSFRMLVGRGKEDGGFETLDSDKRTVRLGQGVFKSGALPDGTMDRAIQCLKEFKDRIDTFAPRAVRAVGTSALREARNRRDFVRRVERELHWKVDILPGTEEARLIAAGIAPLLPSKARALLVDIGGGSTEIAFVEGAALRPLRSYQLGAVRLLDLFGSSDPLSERAFRMMRAFIRNELKGLQELSRKFSPNLVVGSAGTIKSLLKLAGGASREDALTPLKAKDVAKSLEKLRPLPLADRVRLTGLSERRAEVIVPGALLLLELLELLDAPQIEVSERGLVDGLIGDLIENRERHASYVDHLAAQNLAEFGWLCARFQIEEPHVRRVHDLALQLFDGLAQDHRYGLEEKRMLGCAALFHDVGRIVEPARHHKHSYYIIQNLPLSGFTPREVEIIALLARYHRGNLPRDSHEEYVALAKEDRLRVDILAGCLRIAEGLDHSRNAGTLSLKVSSGGKTVSIQLRPAGGPDLDVWAAQSRSDLLERALEKKIEIGG